MLMFSLVPRRLYVTPKHKQNIMLVTRNLLLGSQNFIYSSVTTTLLLLLLLEFYCYCYYYYYFYCYCYCYCYCYYYYYYYYYSVGSRGW